MNSGQLALRSAERLVLCGWIVRFAQNDTGKWWRINAWMIRWQALPSP